MQLLSLIRDEDVSFQYPLTDRGDCNLRRIPGNAQQLTEFQYPLTDRGDCNMRIVRVRRHANTGFSIH